MALIKSVRGFTPKIGKDTFLADNATIIGDVEIGEGCSIWFGAILRGDVNSIRIGNGVNIQDGSVLHTLYEKSTIEIGDDVSIGHNVTIHGAKICHGALIGMGSVVLDHAVIGEGAIVAAGSVVFGCLEQDRCRARQYLCGRTGKVRQEGRSGAGEGDQPEDREKLSHVLLVVRIKNSLSQSNTV